MQLRASVRRRLRQETSPLDRRDTFRLFHTLSFISRLHGDPYAEVRIFIDTYFLVWKHSF